MDERTLWLEHAMKHWENSLMHLAFAYLGDRALAEDAVQDTFLKAWKGYAGFRGEADEKTWLMRILINTCKDICRGSWFRRINKNVSLDQLPESAAPFSEQDHRVTQAVLSLTIKLREVVLLHICEGLSADETANVLGISRSTVFERMKKARKALQIELEG